MVHWVAWQYKFRRSRRMQVLAFLLLAILIVTTANLVGQAARTLFGGEEPSPEAGAGDGGEVVVPPESIEVGPKVPVWREGDFWVWEDGHGLRIVDRVVAVRSIGGTNTTNPVALYDVRRESSAMDGRQARVENITYDGRFLAVRSSEYRGTTTTWLQRTMGLAYANDRVGLTSNASLGRGGEQVGRFLRVANVTAVESARVSVPAGRFTDVTYVAMRFVDYDLVRPDVSRAVDVAHWFSPSVGHDVAFRLANGTTLRLVGYRSEGGFVPTPDPPGTPSWRAGVTWTYEDQAGERRTWSVLDAKAGRITLERRDPGGTETYVYAADDLSILSSTFVGAKVEIDPSGAPLIPEETTYTYVKTVTAGARREFRGNATVDVRGDTTVVLPLGSFEAQRFDIVETEVDAQGRTASFATVRFFAPEVGNDVKVFESGGREWNLVGFDLGPRPLRWDALPGP